MVALPVYGCSGALLQILGPVHKHAIAQASPADAGAVQVLSRGVDQLVSLWKDWQAYAHAQAHAVPAFAHAHQHRHDGFERHHHTPGGDVIAIGAQDAGFGEAGDMGAAAGAGSATLPLALAVGLTIAVPVARRRRWPRDNPKPWCSAQLCRLDRPPRPTRSA